MGALQAFKYLFFVVVLIDNAAARKCIACASSSTSPDFNCIGDLTGNPDVVMMECNPEFGSDQACYTMVTCDQGCYHNPNSGGEDMKWYRGCCNPGPNDWTCPTDQPDHVDSGWYETWRYRCTDEVEGCNNKDPIE